MTKLADESERLRALTDLHLTLLVEAAAGTGKTALMAGRVTMLLASGVESRLVTAITFTALAASALGARVHRYVDDLLAGRIPKPLREALPEGLTAEQRRTLSAAARKLDELMITTIHGFCQTIISSYAVEADVDPGARMLDATQAEAAFEATFEQWFKKRLNGTVRADDPISSLSRDDPRHVASTLKALARFRLEHRGARAPAADLSGRPDINLIDAVADFRRWLSAQPEEPKTLELIAQLETLADHFADSFATPPTFETLWKLAHPARLACMRRHTLDLLTPRTKAAWDKAAGKDKGAELNAEAGRHFARIDHCYRVILGRVATALVAKLSDDLDEVLSEYGAFKRAAAFLDFDDLLERACALVGEHDAIRKALGQRYRHIFVDEFQDTDPLQAEILFRIVADDSPPRWQDSHLRPGALFIVGDPKQAIYRFRGADVSSYAEARSAVARRWPNNVIQITANFRSRPAILAHINRCFAAPLSARNQPGYVELTPTLDPPDHDLPCVAKISINIPPNSPAPEMRDAEAEAVADLCARLIGNVRVRNEDGELMPLTPGGIALLTPTSSELWRYERVFEARGLPIASQAGKGLFRRQEVQDFVALTRVLADGADTLAFGALMRGPIVGLTEEELLDIAYGLPPLEDRPEAIPRFSLGTDPAHIAHPVARQVLTTLQDLRRRTGATTPALLLMEAVERLAVRPILSAREGDRSARAAANVEAFLERARPYGVKGIKHFARDVSRDWRGGAAYNEGRVDAEGEAIEIITIHSAKGLEWPVVIPINTATMLRSRERFVHRPDDDTLHWVIGDVVPPELHSALETDDESLMRERERLWYVACTRARELLIVPELAQAGPRSWGRVVNLGHDALLELDVSRMTTAPTPMRADPPNTQTAELFAAERAVVEEAAVPLTWVRPSDHDPDRPRAIEAIVLDGGDALEVDLPVGAGRVRGLLLHKLLEEVLTGELVEDLGRFANRARELVAELVLDSDDHGDGLPDENEIATTAWRTLQLPDIVALRERLTAEWPIYALIEGRSNRSALAGRIDAVAYAGDRGEVVVDWKSDIDPSDADIRLHAGQLEEYLTATGAPRGALVYMTQGLVRWVAKRNEVAA
jgi:ATP-dependent exoDNAse (exonuclease V) beta subunit